MDITILFKACVKTVRTRNKALGGKETKTDILKKSNRDLYLSKAKEILRQLTTLKDLLSENRKSYLNVINHFSTGKQMSDIDREELDKNAKTILQSCTHIIADMKKNMPQTSSKQKIEHYNNIIMSLEYYVKTISKLYAEQKAVRIKRALDSHKIKKLHLDISKERPKDLKIEEDLPVTPQKIKSIPDMALPINPEDQLSAEEMQMFESENELLFNDLSSLSEEVQQIERKVVHISELQEQFTDKVLEQEKDIERIASNVVGSTENVKDANDQIRQAIQRNAGLRVWILFFLIVMSFSLLFLDWYND